MIKLAGRGNNLEENKKKILEVIKNGKGIQKLKELVKKQGGDVTYIEYPERFEKAPYILPVIANKDGIIQ